MNKVGCFEDLRIWQDARRLVSLVYSDFGAGMRGNRDYGFRDQMQRASISIMNNISEGFERSSDRDFAHFLNIAKASAGEVRSMYYAAEDLQYVSNKDAGARREFLTRISKGISKLETYLHP